MDSNCDGPSRGIVGRKVVLDASGSSDSQGRALRFRWDLGDGTVARAARVEHILKKPGFHRVGLTVHNLQAALDGEIGAIIDALVTHDQAERLKQEVET